MNDSGLYPGIAPDVERRCSQHVLGVGAKLTRARMPLRVLAARRYDDKGHALRAEIQLKALARQDKIAFFTEDERAETRESRVRAGTPARERGA